MLDLMHVLGVNTGTSVDGLDLLLVNWDTKDLKNFNILGQASYAFDPIIKKDLQNIIKSQKTSLEEISNLNFQYSKFIAFLIKDFVQEYSCQIDLIGMHGQTIFHGSKSTWQLGLPSIVAKLTGFPCVGDFRPGDMAIGGGGAPLMGFLDELLLRDSQKNIATLNLGGIANITIMQKNLPTLAYDTGPANTLIDTLMMKFFGQDFDKNGETAFSGKVDKNFVDQIIAKTDYFHQAPPKSTGRELFNENFANKFLDLGNKENIIASVSYLSIASISLELAKYSLDEIYISGGGLNNKFIIENLKSLHPQINFAENSKIHAQYKEALLFSLLAMTNYLNIPNNLPSCTGAKHSTILGVIAKP